jgi:hypothetical protein
MACRIEQECSYACREERKRELQSFAVTDAVEYGDSLGIICKATVAIILSIIFISCSNHRQDAGTQTSPALMKLSAYYNADLHTLVANTVVYDSFHVKSAGISFYGFLDIRDSVEYWKVASLITCKSGNSYAYSRNYNYRPVFREGFLDSNEYLPSFKSYTLRYKLAAIKLNSLINNLPIGIKSKLTHAGFDSVIRGYLFYNIVSEGDGSLFEHVRRISLDSFAIRIDSEITDLKYYRHASVISSNRKALKVLERVVERADAMGGAYIYSYYDHLYAITINDAFQDLASVKYYSAAYANEPTYEVRIYYVKPFYQYYQIEPWRRRFLGE